MKTPISEIINWTRDARERTVEIVSDIPDEKMLDKQIDTINPWLWEIGHAAWFQERWVLRHCLGKNPIRADADSLYDSSAVPHETRWNLPLPSREETIKYMQNVCDAVCEQLESNPMDEALIYFALLSIFHEDMHAEAFTYTRQTLEYPPLEFSSRSSASQSSKSTNAGQPQSSARGFVELAGGSFMLGAHKEALFAFDNEKWEHAVDIKPFSISRTAVTQNDFSEFVNDDGYKRSNLWSEKGRAWLEESGAEYPLYWKRDGSGQWLRRFFDKWVALELEMAMIHVNYFEAEAYCHWKGVRLPTEAEWEFAASMNNDSKSKRLYPWGDEPPAPAQANMDWENMGCISVDDLSGGDTVAGCRQMIGNVWEWTQSDFLPYPGFVLDPYKEYSEPWFKTRKVLRGGSWATRSRLIRNTWRNFYEPHRRDVWSGLRVCLITE